MASGAAAAFDVAAAALEVDLTVERLMVDDFSNEAVSTVPLSVRDDEPWSVDGESEEMTVVTVVIVDESADEGVGRYVKDDESALL